MNIDKNQIMDMLRGAGKHDEANQADSALPDSIDTDKPEHQDLRSKLGVNLDDVKDKLGGLGNLL